MTIFQLNDEKAKSLTVWKSLMYTKGNKKGQGTSTSCAGTDDLHRLCSTVQTSHHEYVQDQSGETKSFCLILFHLSIIIISRMRFFDKILDMAMTADHLAPHCTSS